MKTFAVIGVGGYIAPRHLKAIKDSGNQLTVAFDPNDSVGILDQDFQDVEFFCNFEEFADYLDRNPVDFVSICSPNYLHKSHIAFALRHGSDVICEKPLVLTGSEVDELKEIEKQTGKKVYTVLQLRVHQAIIELREELKKQKDIIDVDLCYLTSRGPWFHRSWKGNPKLSGGLATNIGIHFFDMLIWLLGDLKKLELHKRDDHIVAGFMQFSRANVRWALSIDRKYLPQSSIDKGLSTYRSITFNGKEVEFSKGFTDLHTTVYKDILDGKGYGILDAQASIEIVEAIRTLELNSKSNFRHPLLDQL